MANKLKKYGVCEICGKEFELIHGKGTKVCSKECLGKLRHNILSKNTLTERQCKNCGKIYSQEHWRTSEFCCRDCYWEYRRLHKNDEYKDVQTNRSQEAHEIRKCEICGKEFYVYKNYNKRFCSNECRNIYLQTGLPSEKRKQTMLDRYGTLSLRTFDEQTEKYRKIREEKYQALCQKSNMELLNFVDMHVLHVKCNNCGKDFITNNLSYLPYDKIPCKQCGNEYKDYKPAIMIYNILDEYKIDYIKNDRQIIHPYEIDILIPSKNIGIEVNGNFWHSELCGKDKNYHINKTKLANDKNIKLIHIFEDEISNKFDIVKSRLLALLGIYQTKIQARKCKVKEIDSNIKTAFLNNNHLQGDTNSSINLGLFYNDELISVMTFGKERTIYKAQTSKDKYELIRFASLLNHQVIGGFSKLFAYFLRNFNPQTVKTFADIRWSGMNPTKTVYNKCGLIYEGITKPNYWYMYKTDLLNRKHRYNFTKHMILNKHPECDKSKTEWELMKSLGYNRIWDCGNIKFYYKKSEET